MINNRQTGRRRGRGGGNGNPNGGGNGQQRQGGGAQGNGSRIDNRARGNATQLHEKYKNMASDAQRSGDRVNTEYYLQFADHYFRVISEQRGRFDEQQPQRRGRDEFDYEGDDEFGDEGEPVRAGEQGPAEQPIRRDAGDGRDQGRDQSRDAQRDGSRDGNRDASREANRDGNREVNRDGARREWRERPEREAERPVEPRRDYRNEAPAPEAELIAGQRRAEPLLAGETVAERAEAVLEADRPLDPPAPRRRGRPRREDAVPTEAPSFEPSAGFEADRLPPALTVPANDATPEAKPRRRRLRTGSEETPTAAE